MRQRHHLGDQFTGMQPGAAMFGSIWDSEKQTHRKKASVCVVVSMPAIIAMLNSATRHWSLSGCPLSGSCPSST